MPRRPSSDQVLPASSWAVKDGALSPACSSRVAVVIKLSITLFIKIILLLLSLPASAFDARVFHKVQLHVHTTESDGDDTPANVAAWYAGRGFEALALTDHDKMTLLSPAPLVMLPGVEITSRGGSKPVHVNALCGKSALKRAKLPSPREALKDAVDRAKADGALALVNHPNWTAALSAYDLEAVEGFDLLEIASGHPLVADDGGPDVPPAETLWQRLLDRGRRVYAVGADDSHDFAKSGEDRKPGRAWVEAWGVEPSSASYCRALKEGRFYATTGARLDVLKWDGRTLELGLTDFPPGSQVEFLGKGGRRLAAAQTPSASFQLSSRTPYLRARVTLADGRRLWTQAFFGR